METEERFSNITNEKMEKKEYVNSKVFAYCTKEVGEIWYFCFLIKFVLYDMMQKMEMQKFLEHGKIPYFSI